MPKRYNKITAKKHVMTTTPFRVTKKIRMDSLKNTNLSSVYDEVDNSLKNLLVTIAGTEVESYGISLVNALLIKLTKKIKKIQNRK